MKKNKFLAGVGGLLALSSSYADLTPSSPVAIVGSKTIPYERVQSAKIKAGAQAAQLPMDKVYNVLRDQIVVEEVLTQAKDKANVSQDPELLKLKKDTEKAFELQFFLKKEVKKKTTLDKLKKLYTTILERFKNKKESELAVIIVGDAKSADLVLKDLGSGKDFYEIASKYSVEPSTKKQGGRVGYLMEDIVVQVFGPDAAKSLSTLKENSYTRKAIQKDGRFLILRKGATRAATPPSFESLKPQLENLYAQTALAEVVSDLIKKGNVKVFGFDGKPDTLGIGASAKTPSAAQSA